MPTRIQLSMYVPEPNAGMIESARRVLDPVQHSLIPAHVTLCREDELAQLGRDTLRARFADSPVKSVALQFGKPKVFHEHGILLPCVGGEHEFIALRQHILGSRGIRHHAPHITLAHPRNPKSAGNCLDNALIPPEAISITFTNVKLIEQSGSDPWRVIDAFNL